MSQPAHLHILGTYLICIPKVTFNYFSYYFNDLSSYLSSAIEKFKVMEIKSSEGISENV